MKRYKIFIAEDTKIARDTIIETLEEHAGKNNIEIEIHKAESFNKAQSLLNQSKEKQEHFNIFFCDIDFTEDNKGGKKDSGYLLIEQAFNISPATDIYTYSAQYNTLALKDKYEELRTRGLIVNSLDKSHSEGGGAEWWEKNFTEIFKRASFSGFLHDICLNHQLIINNLQNVKFATDEYENAIIKDEISSNLEIIVSLLRINDPVRELVLQKLIIQLYHRVVELICKGIKTDEEIFKLCEANKSLARFVIKFDGEWQIGKGALRSVISFSVDEFFKFGYKLNDYRNKSVHTKQDQRKIFMPTLYNVLFAHLTLALYSQKGDTAKIRYTEIEAIINNKKDAGYNDLSNLISYLKTK